MAFLAFQIGIRIVHQKRHGVFDACDTVTMCIDVFGGMIATMKARTDNMKKAAQNGFINATDLADYLVGKGLPFRTAYKISGETVAYCIKEGFVLENLPLEKYKEFSELIDADVYDAVDLENCVSRRVSEGGTSVSSVESQIVLIKEKIDAP